MEEKIVRIVNTMAEFLNIEQLKKLQEVILKELSENEPQKEAIRNCSDSGEELYKPFMDCHALTGSQ